jgi:DNA primase
MYDVARLLPIFSTILGESKQYSNNEFYFYCPFCHHHNPHFAVNLGKGKWHCWVCHAAGNRLVSLLYRLEVPQPQIIELRNILSEDFVNYVPVVEEDYAELALPSEYLPLWKPIKSIEYQHALVYLKNRGLTAYDILRYRLGFAMEGLYANRIIIPSYDEDGKLNYFVGRDFFDTSVLKYKNPKVSKNVVGFENSINWKYPIILCEGVMDAIAIKWNAIPLLGTYLQSKLQNKMIAMGVKEIYMALDSDAAKQSLRIMQTFMKEGTTIYLIEMEGKDPSAVGSSDMRIAIRNARKISFRDVVEMKLT